MQSACGIGLGKRAQLGEGQGFALLAKCLEYPSLCKHRPLVHLAIPVVNIVHLITVG
jgi:hypothetical protein